MIKNRLRLKIFWSFSNEIFLLLLIISATISISYAEIIATYSINSITIKNLLPQIGKSSLVLINIDNTIITPKSKMFSYKSPYKGFISELNATNKYNSTANQIIVNLILNRQVVLVEEDWPNFIKKLEEKGAVVFGFTKIEPIFRKIEDFKQRQYQQLSKLGIKFTDKFNDKDIFNFDDNDKNSPSFYHGIIFTDILSNAVALKNFINIKNNFSFDNIIVFSNEKSELMEISNIFSSIEVNYYGIEYLAVTEKNEAPDVDIVKFQRNMLLQTGQWLEDEAAKELIKNNEPVK
ncbi:MAG: DUF2608 domain-containing protein [Rickettsia endosymbiont of Bryobia graminum]|nr:DUF2608 domain-containing protein [Rickettsia endosymbiont of Bryobia graminum]